MARIGLLALLVAGFMPAASAQPEASSEASLELVHEDTLTEEGGFELRAVEYVLDGTPLVPTQAKHPVPPGMRRLDVRVVYEGRSPVFSYVDGYRFVMRGRVTLDAKPGDTVRITSRSFPREGVTVQWQQRPAFLLEGQPQEAVVGIEYGPVENTPLPEAVAARAVDEVLAEARRRAPERQEPPGTCELEPVFFDFKDTRLGPEAEAALQRAARCLLQRPRLRVRLEGHTDVRGPESVNDSLGQGRAQSVAAYLRALGVAAARLVLDTEGRAQPPCPERTPECFAKSRRVELVAEPVGP